MIKATDLMQKQIADTAKIFLPPIKKDYERTHDPVHVWLAITCCSIFDYPYPKWIRTYINDVAWNLLALDNSGKNFYRDVTHTLGLKQSSVSKESRVARDWDIFKNISRMRAEGMTLKAAITQMAQSKGLALGKSSIEYIYKQRRSALNKASA